MSKKRLDKVTLVLCVTWMLGQVWAADERAPLVYTRLRHDHHYLQILRNLQRERPEEERALRLDYEEANGTQRRTVRYYINDQVAAAELTYDELVFEALDRTFKSRLVPSYLLTYDSAEERRRAADAQLVSPTRCARELAYLVRKWQDFQTGPVEPELAALFDSFGAEEPGLLFGNFHWSGNWRQCARRHLLDLQHEAGVVNFRGRYCVAALGSARWAHKIRGQSERLVASGYLSDAQAARYARFFRLQLGVCLPESCDSTALEAGHGAAILTLARGRLRHPALLAYELTDLFCLPDESSELRRLEPAAWLLVAGAAAWAAALAAASLRDARGGVAHPTAWVSALSVSRNLRRLLAMRLHRVAAKSQKRVSPAADDLHFLNALKVLCMPLIIYGHVGMLAKHLDRFPLDYESYDSALLFHLHASTVFLVDWYFVITGFVTSYVAFATRRAWLNTPLDWAYGVARRYWRLAPMYLVVFWFARHLFVALGSGPVWDYGTTELTQRGVCRHESSLWPLLLVANLHPLHEECIMPAWYIANDMQFALVTPFLLVLLARSPSVGWISSVGLLLAALLARAHFYLHEPLVQPLELLRPRADLFMRNNWDAPATYLQPHYRSPAYLVGLLAGHYAYMVLSGQWRSALWAPTECAVRRAARAFTCTASLTVLASMMFGTAIVSHVFSADLAAGRERHWAAAVYSLGHTTTALALALFIVTLLFGALPALRHALSHPAWDVVVRLNYAVYLVQVELLYLVYQSAERVLDFSAAESLKHWLVVGGASYALSVVLTVGLELPLARLEHELVAGRVATYTHRAKKADLKHDLLSNVAQ